MLVWHKNSGYFYTMVIKNIQEALKEVLAQELMSIYEFSASTGLSPSGLKKILDGKTNRIQEGTLRKIKESTDWDFSFVEDKIHFFKKRKDDEVPGELPQPAIGETLAEYNLRRQGQFNKNALVEKRRATDQIPNMNQIVEGLLKLDDEDREIMKGIVDMFVNRGKGK